MSTERRSRIPANRRLRRGGFSLIELMIAMAILMVVMAMAMAALAESQRGINTVVGREADATQAQFLVDAFTAQVRSASSAAVYDCSGLQCNQVWLYDSKPAVTGIFKWQRFAALHDDVSAEMIGHAHVLLPRGRSKLASPKGRARFGNGDGDVVPRGARPSATRGAVALRQTPVQGARERAGEPGGAAGPQPS